MTPARRSAAVLLLVAVVGFAVVAALLVPWDWVPGGRVLPVGADEVFGARQVERATAYSSAQRHLGWASLAVSLVVGLLLGLTRLGSAVVRGLRGWWWWRALLATLLVLAAGEVATAPFSVLVRRNALEAGLSTQPWPGWLRDQVVSLGLSWVYAGLVVLLVVGVARRAPRRWPLAVGAVAAVLVVVGSWIYPVVVEPLFNRFTSLPDGPLRSQVLALAREEGVPVSDVLVADASRRTTTLNAWVSGLGSTRRVVLYDNLVDDVPRRETLVIVAHELGHAKNHDVAVGTTLSALGVAAGVGLLGVVVGPALLRRSGATGVGTPEAVPLLLVLVTVGTLLASPVQSTVSRAVEARADRESLAATGDRAAFERIHERLAVRSLADPDPPAWSQLWFGTHPTALQRIGLARGLERVR